MCGCGAIEVFITIVVSNYYLIRLNFLFMFIKTCLCSDFSLIRFAYDLTMKKIITMACAVIILLYN